MIHVRSMKDADFDMILSWWKEWECPLPTRDMYPLTSYIAEVDGVPVASACLYITNAKKAAWLENLVSNPAKTVERAEAIPALFRYIENMAKAFGYSHLVIMAEKEKLKSRYEALGFRKTMEGVTILVKGIGD